MNEKESDRLFGEIAIDLGFVSLSDVNKALEEQKVEEAIGVRKPIGAYLFIIGKIDKDQVRKIVTIQSKFDAKVNNQAQDKNDFPIVINNKTEIPNDIWNMDASILWNLKESYVAWFMIVFVTIFVLYIYLDYNVTLFFVILVVAIIKQFIANASAKNNVSNNKNIWDMDVSNITVVIIILIVVYSGLKLNQDSKKDLEMRVIHSLKEKLNEGGGSFEIQKVTLIYKSNNQYDGLVEAKKGSKTGKFSITVTTDGDNLMWQTERGYLLNFQ